MATCTKFARLASYSREFGEASHIFPEMTFGECRQVWQVRPDIYSTFDCMYKIILILFTDPESWMLMEISGRGEGSTVMLNLSLRPIEIEIVLSVKINFFQVSRLSIMSRPQFFFSVKIFKIETFQSRLSCVKIFIETVKINWDCQDFWDLSRLFEIYHDISTLSRLFEVRQAQKSWQIEKSWSRNMIKLTNSRSRSRQTVKICQKFHVSADFSISIETFETGRWCQDKIEISWSRLRLLDRWDKLFEIVETYSLPVSRSRVLIKTMSRQIKTPRLS